MSEEGASDPEPVQTRLQVASGQWLDISSMIIALYDLPSSGCHVFQYRPAPELLLRRGLSIRAYCAGVLLFHGRIHFIADSGPFRFCVRGRSSIDTGE
jgi:hypothetical protein